MPTVTPTNWLYLKQRTPAWLSVSMSVVSANSTTTDQKCFKKYQFYGDEIVEFYFLLLLPKQYNVTNNFIAFACIKYHKQSRED